MSQQDPKKPQFPLMRPGEDRNRQQRPRRGGGDGPGGDEPNRPGPRIPTWVVATIIIALVGWYIWNFFGPQDDPTITDVPYNVVTRLIDEGENLWALGAVPSVGGRGEAIGAATPLGMTRRSGRRQPAARTSSATAVDTVTRFGEVIGLAFQLSDDLLDITSESVESGKTPGTDLREGVPTLPVLIAKRSTFTECRGRSSLLRDEPELPIS